MTSTGGAVAGRSRVYRRAALLVSRAIGEETVLVPVRQSIGELESIYTLSAVAAALWVRLETPQTLEGLVGSLVAEYEVEPPQAEEDVRTFLALMAEWQLVEVHDLV